jgi:CheY-like chemotaxis protein
MTAGIITREGRMSGLLELSKGKTVAPQRSVVLVIEDEPLILAYAAEIITNAGFEALAARSGDEAIRFLACRDDIRVVFTDIVMRGCMDGLKLAHAIRRKWPPIQLIVTSAYTTVEEGQLPTGGRFIKKPYQPPDVALVLRELVA